MIKHRSVGLTSGIPLTAALMFGLVLGLVYVYLSLTKDLFIDAPIAGIIIIPGTAVAGAIGLRVAGLRWRHVVTAALIFGVIIILFSRFEFSPFHSFLWLRMDSRMVLDLRAAGIFIVICGAGVFLLPLFDPLVRKEGLAPTFWKVVAVALALTLLGLLADYLFSRGYLLGLLSLIFGSVAALVLAVLGLILALATLERTAAWAGGLGLVLEGFVALVWLLLGSPWFP